jgi:hypothetical protein
MLKWLTSWITPEAYPNGMPVGSLRILVTDEADDSLSADQVLDAISGFGGRRLWVVSVLDANGACLAKRTLGARTNPKKVREALASELTKAGVTRGASPPTDLQARLDAI